MKRMSYLCREVKLLGGKKKRTTKKNKETLSAEKGD